VDVKIKPAWKAEKEAAMALNNDMMKGTINTVVGSIKEGIGRVVGDKNLETEGAIQKKEGQVQKFKGAIRGAFQTGKKMMGVKPNKT
jgi:uncharacterized protein YjbJ (UPF0337 family)